MKVVVLGSTGHIGSFLVPQLVRAGYQVVAVSRGQRRPYAADKAWDEVEQVSLDRVKDAQFTAKVAALHGDVVVDLINFNVAETRKMITTLSQTSVQQYLYCSSIWAHGRATTLPVQPNAFKEPLDAYGRDKYESEKLLKQAYLASGFPATVIMPGQISGPGWAIISPYGNTDTTVFQKIANGERIFLPNFGMETLHHVHAADVAQLFVRAIQHRASALGQSFHAVAGESITLYGYAQAMYHDFQQAPQIDFLPWPDWQQMIGDAAATESTYYHLARSGQYSIENGRRLLGYAPQYSVLETIRSAVDSYRQRGVITVPKGN
ncbi:NAD-dependent epimerase/dehydratase family protein [Lapidilactobacillus achengensis]|uniref:NAD-dependent epimerase/dehydratase family protein n=1 Tax=Lapidilactobacillus achengensis TaxID=2486000 RepID=A0ABW1UQV6_9LACO|nr:NAD-dependent epimerase/dehydratase family protein [Lapidilactobacillus achengensis]